MGFLIEGGHRHIARLAYHFGEVRQIDRTIHGPWRVEGGARGPDVWWRAAIDASTDP
jgi:hypothetical protein